MSYLDADWQELQDILYKADAVHVKTLLSDQVQYCGENVFEVPIGSEITIDFNKLAKSVLNAGYRKIENMELSQQMQPL